MNVSTPLKPAFGVYVAVAPAIVTLPLLASATFAIVTPSPSASVQLSSTCLAVPCATSADLAAHTGLALVTVTFTAGRIASPPCPSVALTVKLSAPT